MRIKQRISIVLTILCLSSLVVKAQNRFQEQKDLQFSHATLKEVIKGIGEAWEVPFLYSDSLIRAERVIDFQVRGLNLEATLKELCTLYSLEFKLKNEKVYLRPGVESPVRAELFGTLKDEQSGEVLAGAVVYLETTRMGAIAGNVGEYKITNIPPGEYMVSGRLLGYTTVSQTISFSPGEKKELNFTLKTKEIELKEAILIADRITDPTTVSEVILKREDLRTVQGLSADPLRTPHHTSGD